MLDAFRQFIQDKNLCNKSDRILIAVSGGMDSVVMLDLFLRSGYDVAIAHCNFKLRGSESDEDAQFVKSLAEKYKVDLFQKICDAGEYAEENHCSVQEAARELRYAWFDELSLDQRFDYIAVGQHLDDQIETFFINLFRGAGVRGLKGMPVARGRIIRPLMFAKRENIEVYAKQNKLQFREDSSNLSDKYLRNKIRLKLLPEFKNIKTESDSALLNSLENLYEDDLILNQLLDEKRSQLIAEENGTWHLKKSELKQLQPINTWLYYLLKPFGFKRDSTNRIVESLMHEQTGKYFDSHSHRLLIDREEIIIKENKEEVDEEYLISLGDTEISTPVNLKLEEKPYDSAINLKTDISCAFFDFDKLDFPLKIRKWKQGDRFVPFGMKGSKLVSDYLIDRKITRFDKEKTYVLVSGEEIVWLIGLRASNDFKVSRTTRQILEINFLD